MGFRRQRPAQPHTFFKRLAEMTDPKNLRAAGGYSRIAANGVSSLLNDPVTRPGMSNADYSKWKRAGQPTSQLEHQTDVHGRSSARNESTKDIMYDPTVPVQIPPSRRVHSTRTSVNPITWEGADEECEQGKARTQQLSFSGTPLVVEKPVTPKARDREARFPQGREDLKENVVQMIQRGHASAATCLLELPAEYSETKPRQPAVAAIPTLGLEPNHAGCNARHQRSGKFSKQFGDPYDYL